MFNFTQNLSKITHKYKMFLIHKLKLLYPEIDAHNLSIDKEYLYIFQNEIYKIKYAIDPQGWPILGDYIAIQKILLPGNSILIERDWVYRVLI